MLDKDTKARIKKCRDILVGKIPDPKAQVEQITIALMYKFMDDMDKEAVELGGKPSFFVEEYEQYSWSKILSPRFSGEERINLYAEAIRKMPNNPYIPQLFRDIFSGSYLPYRAPETFRMFIKEVDGFVYDHSERLGDSYENLLSIMSSQGEAGQFRTPRNIIDFIVEIVDPKKDETVLDPACGTAGFLISGYKHILKNNIDKLTPAEKEKLMNNFVGYDISPDMVKIAKVNMYLHKFPDPKIYEYDTLSSEKRWDETFDVILANPPFMSPKGGIIPHNRFTINSKRAEALFVDYIKEHLNIDGRAGVIIPEGIIFKNENAIKQLRKTLVEDNFLYAVASLPAGVFQPYSGVKTSILLLDRNLAKKTDNILFVKIENDGYDLGAQRQKITDNDLPAAIENINKFKQSIISGTVNNLDLNTKKYHIVNKSQIAENDYIFSFDEYSENDVLSKCNCPLLPLGEICNIESGSRQKGGAVNEGVYSIGGEQITEEGSIRFEKMKYITEAHFKGMKKGVLKRNDVLIVKDGATTGKIGFWDYEYDAAVNEHVFIIRAKRDKIDPKLLLHILKSKYFQKVLAPYIKGIIGGISLKIKEILIPCPSIEEQQQAINKISLFESQINAAKEEIINLNNKIESIISVIYGD